MGASKAAAAESRRARDDGETFEVQQSSATMHQPSWNEGRLDDLNRKVDKGIDRLDDERKGLRGEVRDGFEKVTDEFKAVRSEMKDGFAQTQRMLFGAAAMIIAALIGAPHL